MFCSSFAFCMSLSILKYYVLRVLTFNSHLLYYSINVFHIFCFIFILCYKNLIVPKKIINCLKVFFLWRNSPTGARAASFVRFLDHTQWYITVGRTPLDEGSACRKALFLTTRTRHIYAAARFEPTIPASDRPQTLTLHCSATAIGFFKTCAFAKFKETAILKQFGLSFFSV